MAVDVFVAFGVAVTAASDLSPRSSGDSSPAFSGDLLLALFNCFLVAVDIFDAGGVATAAIAGFFFARR